ncbi:nucleoside deaminase [Clostridium saccharoperbutylacetonicum]|uniref:nucleoside deaminase n=1 Tax=Clostridium saccharoperbutylacetonicum TaxID=36745 RepID=UPI0039EBCF86
MIDFLKVAKEEAILAMDKGEIPVGAVIVKNGVIIGKAHNLKETLKDSTAHAEILAIKEASNFLGDWRLNGVEMYVTLEPCPMCASAIVQSRISKLYIGTFNKDMGACGSVINITNNKWLNSSLEVKWIYDEGCSEILTTFFKNRRIDII